MKLNLKFPNYFNLNYTQKIKSANFCFEVVAVDLNRYIPKARKPRHRVPDPYVFGPPPHPDPTLIFTAPSLYPDPSINKQKTKEILRFLQFCDFFEE
jgi:hypothetical protein